MSKIPQSWHPRPRVRKTARDKASGAHARRLENRALRGLWERTRKTKDALQFPKHTCNGKKSRALRAAFRKSVGL